MNRRDRHRSVLCGSFFLALLIVQPVTVSGALAEQSARPARTAAMPRPAPSFKQDGSGSTRASERSNSSIMVVPRRSADEPGNLQAGNVDRAPLQGNVERTGAGQLQGAIDRGGTAPLAGGVDRAGLVRVPPVFDARTESVPAQVFRGWVERTHPRFSLTLSSSPDIAVIDVKGQWDKGDRTLRNMGIPHRSIRAGALKDIDLSSTKVIVINCAGNVPRESLQKIRDFVARGGYLITTDWALHNFLEKAFPGFVMWNGGKSDQKIVDASVIDPDPVLFAGAVDHAAWKLDDESWTLRVLNSNVRVLAKSEKLAKDDPDRLGVLAVTFAFGRGRILHMVGHFDNNAFFSITNQLPDPAPVIGISLRQALAGNFVISALQKR